MAELLARALSDLLSEFQVIIVPGLHNSGPGHWQTRWEALIPNAVRVQQDDWDHPQLDAWVRRLEELRERDPRPSLFIAHSFGCLTTVTSIARNPDGAAGALLVAPAHPDRFGVARQLPAAPLPCPTVLISSANDPWMSAATAARHARRWDSELIEGGLLGHINAESGLGDWREGQRHLHRLAKLAHTITMATLP